MAADRTATPITTVEFGAFLTPDAGKAHRVVELAVLADVLGYDHVSVQDHPYVAGQLDTWTLLSTIAAQTSAVRVSPNVANLPLRPPVVLAKAAATLDVLSGGRVELGLGAGGFWDGIVAAGGPRRTPKQAVDAVIEAIAVIRAFWSGETVRIAGEHYRAEGLRPGPRPAHPIPIWLGAYGPRMLRVTGRLADAWIPSLAYAGPEKLTEMNAIIDDAAAVAGRTPSDIRRMYNINGRFGTGSELLQGTPRDWAEQLVDLSRQHRIATFILGTDDPDQLRQFAEEVMPAVTEQLTEPPADPAPPGIPTVTTIPGPATATRSGEWPYDVTPTPDDGVRLTGPLAWDESARPDATPRTDTAYRPDQLAHPQHLIDIHDHLRTELLQVRGIVDQVRSGHLQVGQARSVINTMTMRQNAWTLGAYCQSYCRVVTTHHTLEDRSVFTRLRALDPELGPVLHRLESEHEVIADVLDQVDEALVSLATEDGYGTTGTAALDELQHAVDLLTDTLLSHLAYEERALFDPLATNALF